MLLERRLPFCPYWNHSHNDTRIDITSTTVLFVLMDPLLKYIAPVATVALYAVFDLSSFYNSLSGDFPFCLQLLLVTLLIELARYWLHRLHHKVDWLWWLHAMHHSSQRLYALNNFRFHPLNYLLMFMLSVFPLMLLGVPADLLLGYLALSLPVIMLQHANIDLQSGIFNYMFSSNELHRWHHSASAAEANYNYGHALIIWDQLFGTFKYHPDTNKMPQTIGLFKNSSQTYPAQSSYLVQLRSMFCWKCCWA
jgi:sterol desaturase/sphingolipid hydroxylase (fatty acid hydroxylase superfamily)